MQTKSTYYDKENERNIDTKLNMQLFFAMKRHNIIRRNPIFKMIQ